jgi:CBS domain-containing protein
MPVVESINNPVFLGIVSSSDVIRIFVEHDYNPVKKNIDEIMQKNVVFVSPDDHVSKVWDKMRSGEYSGFPVVNDKEKVVGFLSRRDVFLRGSVRLSKESGKTRVSTVSKIMRQLVAVVTPDKTTKEVAKFMVDKNVIRIPIVNNEKDMKLVGIVDAEDILRAYTGV